VSLRRCEEPLDLLNGFVGPEPGDAEGRRGRDPERGAIDPAVSLEGMLERVDRVVDVATGTSAGAAISPRRERRA
jgi:hypothetical protein